MPSPMPYIVLVQGDDAWSSFISAAWPAFAAILTAFLVQVYLVPRTSRRHDAETLWQAHVRDLGAFVSTEFAMQSADWAVTHMKYIREQDMEPPADPEKIRALWSDAVEMSQLILSSGLRVSWLAGLVLQFNPTDPRVVSVQEPVNQVLEASKWAVAVFDNVTIFGHAEVEGLLSSIEKRGQKLNDACADLSKLLITILKDPPHAEGWWARLRRKRADAVSLKR